MPNITEILENESGLQYSGVTDESSKSGSYPNIGLITGVFKRGCYNQPMTITKANQRAMLGYEPENPAYAAVADALDAGLPSVQVLRVKGQSNTICLTTLGFEYSISTYPENLDDYDQHAADLDVSIIMANGSIEALDRNEYTVNVVHGESVNIQIDRVANEDYLQVKICSSVPFSLAG